MAAPLTRENLDEINEALKASKDVKAVIARAKTAGIEVEEIEKTLLDNEKRLQAIKSGFVPSGRA